MSARLSAAVCAAALLAACASAPTPVAEFPAAAGGDFVGLAQGPYTPGAPAADWWRLYDDPTLDALVAQALAENNELAAAAANLAQVRAALGEARAGRWPSTTVSAAGTYGEEPVGMGGTGEAGEIYSAGLDVAYEVDLFGRVRSAIAAARADAQAAEAALEVVRISVAAETARAYADACSANAQITVAEQTIGLQQRTVELTQTLLSGGRGTGLDVARAQAALQGSRAALPPLRAARDGALFRLATLTGRTPAEASAAARACARPPQLNQPIPVGDGAGLLARRPDVRQAERQLAAAAARVGVATASLYPSITLGGSIGSTATDLGDLGGGDAFRFSVGPLISWSFPNIAVARARVAGAEAGAEAALARFDQAVLTALQETETALSAYANELDRRAALVAARDQAAEAARLARLRFDAGADSFLSVLDAERTLAQAEAALAQSEAQVASYQITVFKALAGGWSADAPAAG